MLPNKKIIAFDVDGTLTGIQSWTKLTEDLGASVSEHMTIYNKLRNNEISYLTAKEQLMQEWKNTGKLNRDHLLKIFASWPIKKEALDRYNRYHNQHNMEEYP